MHVHGSRQSSARPSSALLSLACLSFFVWWHLCHRTVRTEQATGWMLLGLLMLCAGAGLFLAVLHAKEGLGWLRERRKAVGFAVTGVPNEIQLRLLLDSTAEGIYALDPQGNCTFCNSAGLRLLGFPDMNSVSRRNMRSLVHHTRSDGSPHPASQCHILSAVRLAECVRVEDEPFWRVDGMPLFVEYWARPIIQDGKVEGAAVAFHDITIRKQAQEALKDQARQLQALFDNTRDAAVIEDGDGRIVDANHAAAEMFGLAHRAPVLWRLKRR